MRTLRIASAVAASALLVGGLTACSSKTTSSPGAAPSGAAGAGAVAGKQAGDLSPKDALLASAAVMEKAGSAKLIIAGENSGDDGSATYQWKAPQSMQMTMNSDGQDTKMIVADGFMYISVDAEMSATAGGRHWMKLDPKTATGLDKASGGEGQLGSVLTLIQVFNPAVQLAASAQGGKLAKVGTERVDGADTVHYRSELPVGAIVDAMTTLTADQKKLVLGDLKKDGDTDSFEFWINAKGELVKETSTNLGSGTKGTSAVTYSQLGTVAAVQAPPAGDVLDMASMLKGLGNG